MDKQNVLDHMADARAELLASIEGLSQAEMTALPVSGDWTVKQILAHLSGWSAWDLGAILEASDGEIPDFAAIEDVDAFNARLVAERNSLSVDDLVAEMDDTLTALLAVIVVMPDEDLFFAPVFGGPWWGTLAEWLQVGWEHEAEHAAQIRAWRAGLGHVPRPRPGPPQPEERPQPQSP